MRPVHGVPVSLRYRNLLPVFHELFYSDDDTFSQGENYNIIVTAREEVIVPPGTASQRESSIVIELTCVCLIHYASCLTDLTAKRYRS
jgi:hypothetical protein